MLPANTQIDYLRHGEPEGGSRFRGHGIDDPLSEKGWAQMRTTALSQSGWTRIISSPMQRCLAFAEWIAAQHGLPVEPIDDLREIGFGSWEGKTRELLLRERPDEYQAFYADPVANPPPGAEPLTEFGRRVARVFDALAAEHPGQHLLVVSHAGVIRATLGHVLQAPPACWYRAAVDNAALSRFLVDHQGVKLQAHNWRPTQD